MKFQYLPQFDGILDESLPKDERDDMRSEFLRMPQWVSSLLLVIITMMATSMSAAEEQKAGFTFQETPGQSLDILQNGRTVARYQLAYDPTDFETLHETYKPYLHVFDADGKAPITKGAGGQFTHHRGIFIGWNKIRHQRKTYDRWHMIGGEIVHQKFLKQSADDQSATFTSLTHWNDAEKQPILIEERTLTFRSAPEPARLLIDFQSKLTPVGGDISLRGDPEHAGVQFRPANEVDRKATTYLFPQEGADPHKDKDYPWVGESFTLNGSRHSVIHLNHPTNPRETVYSAYRDYGRFGAFFEQDIPEGESLEIQYRFVILDGELPERKVIERFAADYAGKK